MKKYDMFGGKVIYTNCAKCGSSTNFAYGSLLRNGIYLKEITDIAKNTGVTITRAYYDYNEELLALEHRKFKSDGRIEESKIEKDAIRYCVVRDPVNRFVSMFKSLVSSNRYISDIDIDTFMDVIDCDNKTLAIKWPEKRTNGWEIVKAHCKSHVESCGPDAGLYSHIFNMSQMYKVKELLEKSSGFSLPDLKINNTDNTPYITLNSAQVEWVKRRYSCDYDVYGKWF